MENWQYSTLHYSYVFAKVMDKQVKIEKIGGVRVLADIKTLFWKDSFLSIYNTDNLPIIVNHYIYDEYENTFIHQHDFIEMSYVISGRGTHVIANEKVNIVKGHIAIIDEYTPHSMFPTNPRNDENLAVFNCMFKKDYFLMLLNKHLKDTGIFQDFVDGNVRFLFFQDDNHYQLSQLFEKLFREYMFKLSNARELLELLTGQIFIGLNRLCLGEVNSGHVSRTISSALKYIEEHYNEKISVSELSRSLNISKSHLSTLFKKCTGFSILEYVQKRRIEHACHYIIDDDSSFREVAFKVGYSDYVFFLKIFKKLTGMTPREFKNSCTD